MRGDPGHGDGFLARPAHPTMTRLAFPPGIGRRPADEELDLDWVAPGEPVGSLGWWQQVARQGTPLRRPGNHDGVDRLVFLHRNAEAPLVYLDLNGLTDREDLTTGTMTPVSGTDVHVAAFGVEPEYVASYALVPLDGPLHSPSARDTPEARAWWLRVLAGARYDELNPGRRFTELRGSLRSVVEMPSPHWRASTETEDDVRPTHLLHTAWIRPDGVHQRVWVHLPPGARGPVGAVLLFDGQMWMSQLPVTPVLDALHAEGALPPTAAVLLDSMAPTRRAADLARSDGYLDALADDLFPRVVAPLLETHGCTLLTDPRRTVVAGQSYGGLAAFRAAARRPDRFGATVSQSGSFWWPETGDPASRAVSVWLRSAPPREARTVLQAGRYEGELTAAHHELVALIRDRGEWLDAQVVPGGHDWAWWSRRLGGALVSALAC